MPGVRDLINKFEGKTREHFVFSGHGGWSVADGTVRVPPLTTISFYIADTLPLDSSVGVFVDRRSFNDKGQLVNGAGQVVTPTEVFKAGEGVKNYRLYPRNKLDQSQWIVRDRTGQAAPRTDGGNVKGIKTHDVRFGNNSKIDRNFVTVDAGSLSLAQIFADSRFQGADLHWAACRVVC